MNQEQAYEILKKLKPYEKNSESENGMLIHKFFAVPLNENYNIQDLWGQSNYFATKEYSTRDFKIVGYHRNGEIYLQTKQLDNIIAQVNQN